MIGSLSTCFIDSYSHIFVGDIYYVSNLQQVFYKQLFFEDN